MTRPAPRVRTLVALAVAAPLWLVACSDAPTGATVTRARATGAAYDESPLASPVWQAKATQLTTGAGYSPLASIRLHALVGIAQYGAVVSADFGGGSAQYAARRGAVAGASAQLLSSFFPSAAATLEQMVLDDGAAAPGNTRPHYERGVAAGRAMGDRMKAWAAADGFSKPWNGVPLPTGPGLWTQAPVIPPAGFQFPTMKPYFLTTQSQFRSEVPPPFGSAQFGQELAFVRQTTIGRTAEQAAISNFWNTSPTGAWFARGAAIAEAKGLDEREVAHLFALEGGALLDAAIGCFDAKYAYQYIRPGQADALVALLFAVPNHPSYPSGHSCISGAAITVLSWRFSDDPGVVDALHALMVEAGMSRIYAGLHYPFDVAAGQTLGRRVAEWAIAYDNAHGLLTAVAP